MSAKTAKVIANPGLIGKYIAKVTSTLKIRLARQIVRRRSFVLFLACESWAYALLIAFFLSLPSRYPDRFWVSLAVTLSPVVAVLTAWVDVYYKSKRRFRRVPIR